MSQQSSAHPDAPEATTRSNGKKRKGDWEIWGKFLLRNWWSKHFKEPQWRRQRSFHREDVALKVLEKFRKEHTWMQYELRYKGKVKEGLDEPSQG